MTASRVYLDWNATAPLRPEARAATLAAMDFVGNPSSVHAEGRAARAIVETARRQVARLVGAEPQNVIFTSGATEAAAMALTPDWMGDGIPRPAGRLYVSAIEHPCVLAGGRFPKDRITRLDVTRAGAIDLSRLEAALLAHDKSSGRPLVALMGANNETGILQPLNQALKIVRRAGGLLVSDAVQLAGRLNIEIGEMADAILLSAHKLGGPKGIGALVLANESVSPAPLLTGGGQERRHRAGTENVPAIAGFGAAAAAAEPGASSYADMLTLRDRLEDGLSGRATVIGKGSFRLSNTSLIAPKGASAETLVMQLDLEGIAVSAGAACSSGKVAPSHVLAAMGVPPDVARAAIRVSFGPTTTEADIDALLAALADVARRTSV